MSYDISSQVQNARSRAELALEDQQRLEFLRTLHESGLRLTPWEDGFVKDFATAPRGFTPAQRDKADELKKTIPKPFMNRDQFIYRHSKFPPTTQNIFLLGFMAGVALMIIVALVVTVIP
jgi:hypothetical protein